MTFSELRGKIGGTVYSRNRSGNYSRWRGYPTNPQTAPQEAARTRFVFLLDRWTALTQDQKIAWNNYAPGLKLTNSIGSPSRITGKQAYLRFNNLRYNNGSTIFILDAPPTSAALAPAPIITNFSATWDISLNLLILDGDLQAFSAPASQVIGDLFSIYASDPRSSNHFAYHRSWYWIDYLSMSNAAAQPVPFTKFDTRTIWNAAGGEACFLKVVVSHKDGRISVPAIARCITTSQA